MVMCMDILLDSITSAQAESAYHNGVMAAIDGLPFSAPEGLLLRFYQAGWDDGISAAQAWVGEATE
jgi:hypothetical protein